MSLTKGGALAVASELFQVLSVPWMGRGLFALRDLPTNTVVLQEEPLVSTPPVSKVQDGSWCQACCSPGFACGHEQEPLSVDLSPLIQYCEEKRFKWPILMAKLAKRALNERSDDGDDVLERMKFLCSVNLKGREAHLEEQRQVLLECLSRHKARRNAEDIVTEDWYMDMYSRIQANAFRLDLIDATALQGGSSAGFQSMLQAMLAQQEGDNSGSAVYTVASLVNHSCVPNMDVTFPKNDGTIALRTNQHVKTNEQLTISYIDHEVDVDERARRLAMYGFHCECEKCREERM